MVKTLPWRRLGMDSSKMGCAPGSFLAGILCYLMVCHMYDNLQAIPPEVVIIDPSTPDQNPGNTNSAHQPTGDVSKETQLISEVALKQPLKTYVKKDPGNEPNLAAKPSNYNESTGKPTQQHIKPIKVTPSPAVNDGISSTFRNAVLRYRDKDRVIVLSSGDSGYLDMALNLFKTSYEKFGLKNHLFLGSDLKFCEAMISYGANCVTYILLEESQKPSDFNSKSFMTKSYVKAKAVRDALALNTTVLFVDLDVVFFRNPLPDLRRKCGNCDLAIQTEGFADNLNTGFYMVRPTLAARSMLQRACSKMNLTHPAKQNDQRIINRVLIPMRKNNEIKQVTLSMAEYPFGIPFFDNGRRVFRGDNPCTQCMVVHNNGMLGIAAKRYRFKEYGLWQVDQDGYYSDPDRKYIMYDNTILFPKADVMHNKEVVALKTALVIGHILNRTVIVPKFHVKFNITDLSKSISVAHLDASLPHVYREHGFLQHELVPAKTKWDLSEVYLLQDSNSVPQKVRADVQVRRFQGAAVPSDKIRQWFMYTKAHVLRFHSLYIDVIPDKKDNFTTILQHALRKR